jgi:hypothetical protein
MNAYQLYKPFRNYICQFPLVDSLRVLHSFLQNSQFDQPISQDIELPSSALGFAKGAHDWELELLCKEVILNAGPTGSLSLAKWNNFSSAINKIRKLENGIYGSTPAGHRNVLHEIFRIAHRQFHWQRKPQIDELIRHYKIFAYPPLDDVLQREVGLSARQIYLIGMALLGHFATEVSLIYPTKSDIPPVTQEQFDRFVNKLSVDMKSMREQISDSQRYDADYAYSYNPMRQYPLILTESNSQQLLLAPIPTLLFRKFTNGIYYDVVSAFGFSNAYGEAFQRYVGEVLQAVEGAWRVLPEERYWVRNDDSLCDIGDLESALQVMAMVGIETFMRRKTAPDRREWNFQPFIGSDFSEAGGKIRGDLFPDALAEISPHLE